jgi:nucleoside-diphosphate-sugar epimerase
MKHTILGAGGAIANRLTKELDLLNKEVRLVSRKPKKVTGKEELFPADLLDAKQVQIALADTEVAYLVVGLPYKAKLWAEQWPIVMKNVIDACKATNTKLVFFDNIYMYNPAELNNLTEQTAIKPCSDKGATRALIANMLTTAMAKGEITACIARSADFYGYGAENSVLFYTVIKRLQAGKSSQWLLSDDKVHALTYVTDAAKGTALLGCSEAGWGEVWHLPTAQSETGKQIVAQFCKAWGAPYALQVMPKWMLNIMGFFIPEFREIKEMSYQFALDYRFNSGKFEKEFGMLPTSLSTAIAETVAAYKKEK